MKEWILIANMLNFQPVYDNQATCELAARKLAEVYYQQAAVCIPKPNQANDLGRQADAVFDSFYRMVERMQKLEAQRVDTPRR